MGQDDKKIKFFKSDRRFKIEQFEYFLTQQLPNNVLHAKGILWFQESSAQYIFQLKGLNRAITVQRLINNWVRPHFSLGKNITRLISLGFGLPYMYWKRKQRY